jgi:Na+-translocating ferredoxin:NAD+ oxidoreductase RnfG subunit
VKAWGRGYASNIGTTVGVDSTGTIVGMKITSEQETPGLGARIEEVKSGRTVLDAIRAAWGGNGPRKLLVQVEGKGTARGVEVEIKDATMEAELERAIARRDTAGVDGIIREMVTVGDQDTAILASPALAYEVSKHVVRRLLEESSPWWQVQFMGKSRAQLVVTREKTDRGIQAVTGATVSSRAVTESVKNAIVKLEQAIGGFQEGTE